MPKSIGKVIKVARERAGITRHALAKAAKIDPAVLARVENEERPGVQFATVCRLAVALDVSLDDLAVAAGLRIGVRTPAAPSPYPFLSARARGARSLIERALRELDSALNKE